MTPQPKDRLVALDGLRLIAALMVVLFHFSARYESALLIWRDDPQNTFPLIHRFGDYGWMGVELFFIISGFVICMSAWGRDTGAFFKSRITRLFPAFWPAVLLSATMLALWPQVRPKVEYSNILTNLTMLNFPLGVRNVDDVYWTLWSEARFYLLFALVVWRGLTLERTLWFGYLWLVGSVIGISAQSQLLNVALQPQSAPLFVAGIGLYLIHRFGHDLRIWGMVVASFLLAQQWLVQRVASGETDVHHHLSLKVAVALLACFFIIVAVIAMGGTSRIRWRWLPAAGALTYPLYLLHEDIGWTIIYHLYGTAPDEAVLAFVIAVMVLAAWLLHTLIEKPLARLLRAKMSRPLAAIENPPAAPRHLADTPPVPQPHPATV
jgi:peptidoglycan/LPS O-acetylase OafA/YrhL